MLHSTHEHIDYLTHALIAIFMAIIILHEEFDHLNLMAPDIYFLKWLKFSVRFFYTDFAYKL